MTPHLPQPEVKSTPEPNPEPNQDKAETPESKDPPIMAPKGIAAGGVKRNSDEPEVNARNKPESPQKDLNGRVDQFFSPPERIPIQIFNEETKLQKLGHWGPMLTGVASIVLTLFVWLNTKELTSRQIDLTKEQVELQSRQIDVQREQVEAELADMRFNFLSDLTATDESKKTSAEIGLASHGLKAFPVVHFALGVEQGDIRRSAVNVVYRLFQAETNNGREELLRRLRSEFLFPNKTLHVGIIQSFVKIEPLLSQAQRADLINFLQSSVVPQNACSDQEGREMVFEVAKFLGSNRADAIPYLLSVIKVARCGDAWLQAMYNLQNVARQTSAQEQAALRENIEEIKKDVLNRLHENISTQELANGAGFAGFLKPGEVGIEFEDFKKRIEKEFDSLSLK